MYAFSVSIHPLRDLYPFIHWEIRRLFPCLSDCEYCCSEHGSADISSRYDFFSFRYILSRAPPILEIFPIWGSRGLLSMEDTFVPYAMFPWTPGWCQLPSQWAVPLHIASFPPQAPESFPAFLPTIREAQRKLTPLGTTLNQQGTKVNGEGLVAQWKRIRLPLQETGATPGPGRSHMLWSN